MITNPINKNKEQIINTKDKSYLSIYTHLKQIYSDFKNDKEEIEFIYEEMRKKFKSDYKVEAEFFCRVPYAITLFGDEVTKLFDDKIVTTTERDLITCANRNKDKLKFVFNTHNTFTNPIEIDLFDSKHSFEDYPDYFKYFWSGYQTCVRYINADTIFGVNFLVNLNIVDYHSFNLLPTMFLSAFLITLCLYGKHDTINTSIIADIAISEISKLGFYNPTPIVFAQLFLPRNSFGIYVKGIFNFYTINEAKNYQFFFCDSFSKDAPIYYSCWNQQNKRLVEVRLGLALLLRRYRKQITTREICELSSNIKKFIQYFENNLDTIFGLVENFLKKTPYKIKDIKEELNFDVKDALNGIPNYQMVLTKVKDFSLYPRLIYVFKEYERIEKVLSWFKQLGISTENEEKVLLEKILISLKESNISLKSEYECFNDEIDQIESIREIDKTICDINNTGNKLISKGWTGTIAFLGESRSINLISKIVENFFNRLEEKEDINLWLSDDTNNMLFRSKIGGNACLLNPIYDDFYMFDIQDENINEIHKSFMEKLNTFKKEEKSENDKKDVREETGDNKNIFDIRF